MRKYLSPKTIKFLFIAKIVATAAMFAVGAINASETGQQITEQVQEQ